VKGLLGFVVPGWVSPMRSQVLLARYASDQKGAQSKGCEIGECAEECR
jgi:hypothetical protein